MPVDPTVDPTAVETRFREDLDPPILPQRLRELAEICRKLPVRNP